MESVVQTNGAEGAAKKGLTAAVSSTTGPQTLARCAIVEPGAAYQSAATFSARGIRFWTRKPVRRAHPSGQPVDGVDAPKLGSPGGTNEPARHGRH